MEREARAGSWSIRDVASEHTVLDAFGAGVIAIDKVGLIHWANEHAGELLGHNRDRLIGQHVETVFAPVELIESAVDGRGIDSRRLVRVKRGDGVEVSLGFTVGKPRQNGTPLRHVVLFQDLTSVEDLRRQRDRLLQLATLEDALPSMLHELRNPLAAVTALLECLHEEAEGSLRDDLSASLEELRRMTLMIQSLGGVARPIRSDKACDTTRAVRESCRVLEAAAARRGVTIHSPKNDLPHLYVDRAAVSGVVFNLVKNAIDACEAGAEVFVEIELHDGVFVLRVRDTGCGMSPAVLARAAQLFFTTKRQGSGLGLALCKQVAESGNGTLDVQSREGIGTSVELRVPSASVPEKPVPSGDPFERSTHK